MVFIFRILSLVLHLRDANGFFRANDQYPKWIEEENFSVRRGFPYWLFAASSPWGVIKTGWFSRSMTGKVSVPSLTVMGQALLQAGGR